MLLDHFGDSTPGAPIGRCCDACAGDSWLPEPEELEVAKRRTKSQSAGEGVELTSDGEALFESLREWRLRAADGKPAFTIAHNSTLERIAATRPAGEEALLAIKGIGPNFVTKYADEVLALVAGEPPPDAGADGDLDVVATEVGQGDLFG
jgi:superfamily II DNA helicase RecQ